MSWSFQPGGFFPDEVAAVSKRNGELNITIKSLTGATASGDGFLGRVEFEAREGFRDSTKVEVTSVILGLSGAREQVEEVYTAVYIVKRQGFCADFDGNGVVDFPDFIQFARHFGSREGDPDFDGRFDLDGNGEVAFGDFLRFAVAYGKPCM